MANAAIDLVLPASTAEAATAAAQPAEQPQAAYALASVSSLPVEIQPTRVKTIPMLYRQRPESLIVTEPAEPALAPVPPAVAATPPVTAAVPLPRPRPASAPATAMVEPIAHQAGALAIAAATATHKINPEDGQVLGAAGIERMKTALALTAEQEEYWPAIAAELLALGKAMKASGKTNGGKINVDQEAVQRLYWAAAPLITRLSYEQKTKVKQMARMMGLNQVAEAL